MPCSIWAIWGSISPPVRLRSSCSISGGRPGVSSSSCWGSDTLTSVSSRGGARPDVVSIQPARDPARTVYRRTGPPEEPHCRPTTTRVALIATPRRGAVGRRGARRRPAPGLRRHRPVRRRRARPRPRRVGRRARLLGPPERRRHQRCTADDVLGRSQALGSPPCTGTGALKVGDLAVVVAVAAPHRGQAFDACRELIDTLKADIPIWKHQSLGRRVDRVGGAAVTQPTHDLLPGGDGGSGNAGGSGAGGSDAQPPARRPVPSTRPGLLPAALLTAAFVAIAVAAALTFVGLPYVVMSPGPATNILGKVDGKPLLSVEGATTYPTSGTLDFTTVSVDGGPGVKVTVFDLAGAWLSGSQEIVPEDQIFPPEQSEKDAQEEGAAEMAGSQSVATATALRALGRTVDEIDRDRLGARQQPEQGRPQARRRARHGRRRPRHHLGCRAPAVQRHGPATPSPSSCAATARSRPSPRRPPTPAGAPSCGVVLRLDYDLPVDVMRTGNVGGPSAGLMFSLAIYDALTPGELTGGKNIAGTGTMDDEAVGRPDRRHPPEADRRPTRRGRLLPRAGRQLRRRRRQRARRPAGGQGRDVRRRRRRRARHRHRQGGRPADLRLTLSRGSKVARSACTRPGAMSSPGATRSSLSWSRWRRRQRAEPSRVTATTRRTSARPGCSATARSAAASSSAELALGLGRHDDPLDGQGAPGHLLGPGDPGEQVLEAVGLGSSSCSTALSAPATASCTAIPSARPGSAASRSSVGTRANRRTGWSQPERATCRSVSRAARVSGSVTGWGGSVTAPWCPMVAQVAGVHCSPTVDTGHPRRRDEVISESLGVVRRAHGPG